MRGRAGRVSIESGARPRVSLLSLALCAVASHGVAALARRSLKLSLPVDPYTRVPVAGTHARTVSRRAGLTKRRYSPQEGVVARGWLLSMRGAARGERDVTIALPRLGGDSGKPRGMCPAQHCAGPTHIFLRIHSLSDQYISW